MSGRRQSVNQYKPKSATEALIERQKYVHAFNDTMLKIWRERITLLGVVDTGRLLASPKSIAMRADGTYSEIQLSQSFLEYGIWQDYGTGKEVPRGNPGDIGREKKRKRRKWFSPKYYASVMNIKEFMAENLGKQFLGIVSNTFDKKQFGADHSGKI